MSSTHQTIHHPSKVAASERVYSLDALRAVMMLLGIVIHAGITYASIDYGRSWSLKDPNNSLVFDVLVGFIHAFRMPVFFVAAGYFSSLLFYKKGPKAMLINRVKRIVLPFLLGVLIIHLSSFHLHFLKHVLPVQHPRLVMPGSLHCRGYGFRLMWPIFGSSISWLYMH
jgi:fucose 4-O-acetylase-like acetyltransferase